MREFTDDDVQVREVFTFDGDKPRAHKYSSIYCDMKDLVEDQPKWMKRGLQETRSGYGARLNSGYKIKFEGKLYRIYVTIYSNAGSSWFKTKGRTIYVHA